ESGIAKKEWRVQLEHASFVQQTVDTLAKEWGVGTPASLQVSKSTIPDSASIVVATLNGGAPLIKAINGMLEQDFSGEWEIIVVDDGSWDGLTRPLLEKNFGKNKKVKLIFLPRSGVCKARNAGIRAARFDVVINMDHDCVPQKKWLQTMVNGFYSPKVGAVSAYGHFGGTSTGFRKNILTHLGGYDEDFFYYREDTDLSFRIMELGFIFHRVPEASKMYSEDRTLVSPKGMRAIVKYTIQRLKYHMNDVLLHKKHPTEMCRTFLHARGTFFADPVFDFSVATGLWNNPLGEMELSSPRGLHFFKSRGIVGFSIIVLGGLAYAFAIKWARLAGSLKHGHLFI
ncbi:MAG: glycosyltransferase family A protein, partial [archaeon]